MITVFDRHVIFAIDFFYVNKPKNNKKQLL